MNSYLGQTSRQGMSNRRKRYCQHYQQHWRGKIIWLIINTVCFIHAKDFIYAVNRKGATSLCKYPPPPQTLAMRGFPRSKMRGNGTQNIEGKTQTNFRHPRRRQRQQSQLVPPLRASQYSAIRQASVFEGITVPLSRVHDVIGKFTQM